MQRFKLGPSIASFLLLGTVSQLFLFSAGQGYIFADFESATGLGPGAPDSPISLGSSAVGPEPASALPTISGGKTTADPYPTLGPLLSQRVTADAAMTMTGTRGSVGPGELVRLTIYVDSQERLADIADFLTHHGAQLGRPFVGQAGDVFGGALTATVPVSLLLKLAAQPGVRYVRERIPPRSDQTAPTSRFPDGAKAVRGGSEQPR